MTEQPTQPEVSRKFKVGVWGVVVLIGLVIWLCTSRASGDPAEGNAPYACRSAVEDQLKAPSTAKFSGEAVEPYGSRYVVTGHVDAQNSFGAMIRMSYRCMVENHGDGSPEDLEVTSVRVA